jgi:hypothetical protein
MYSVSIWADPYRYATEFGATVSHDAFFETFLRRFSSPRMHVPTEVEQAFLNTTDVELEAMRLLLVADRIKQVRAMSDRADTLDQRLACEPDEGGAKSAGKRKFLRARADLRFREKLLAQGGAPSGLARLFPGGYAPVLVCRDGLLEVRPMRYKCRPAHADSDKRVTGSHHIPRSTLPGAWRDHFGATHGVVALDAIYDVVSASRVDESARTSRTASLQVQYTCSARQPLFAACLWSHWQRDGLPDLWSFGTLTKQASAVGPAALEQPDVVLLRREDVMAWLLPNPQKLLHSLALLDRPPHVRMLCARVDPRDERRARPT